MDQTRLSELRSLVTHFHGQNPTDKELIEYCEQQGIEAIDTGTLEDWTFQYDVDALRTETLPLVCRVIEAWGAPSEFDSPQERQQAFKDLERAILSIFEERNTPFNVLTSVLESMSAIGTAIKSAGLLATDKKVAVANRLMENHFEKNDPNTIGVGTYAQACKDLVRKE